MGPLACRNLKALAVTWFNRCSQRSSVTSHLRGGGGGGGGEGVSTEAGPCVGGCAGRNAPSPQRRGQRAWGRSGEPCSGGRGKGDMLRGEGGRVGVLVAHVSLLKGHRGEHWDGLSLRGAQGLHSSAGADGQSSRGSKVQGCRTNAHTAPLSLPLPIVHSRSSRG